MRTSLALFGASIALLKWGSVSDSAGYLVAFLAIVALVTSTLRYFRVMKLLDRGQFEPNVHGIMAVFVVVVATFATAFALVHIHEL